MNETEAENGFGLCMAHHKDAIDRFWQNQEVLLTSSYLPAAKGSGLDSPDGSLPSVEDNLIPYDLWGDGLMLTHDTMCVGFTGHNSSDRSMPSLVDDTNDSGYSECSDGLATRDTC